MKSGLKWLVVFAAASAVIGCGSSTTVGPDGTTVTNNPDGSVKISSKDGDVTMNSSKDGKDISVSTPQGNATMGGGGVTEENIGVKFYPGAKEKENSAFKFEGDSEKSYSVTLTTEDDPTKVVDWYKQNEPSLKATTFSAGGKSGGMLTGEPDKETKIAMTVLREDGKTVTEITISKGWKKKS